MCGHPKKFEIIKVGSRWLVAKQTGIFLNYALDKGIILKYISDYDITNNGKYEQSDFPNI